jgi:cytochrome c oxidase subunit 2
MIMGRIRIVRVASLALLLVSAILLSGCEYFSSPQNTFNPGGTVAQQQKDDFLLVMWPSLVVGLIVIFGILFIAVRFRRKPDDPSLPKQIHGNTALELSWTVIPIILLAVIAVPTVEGIRTLSRDLPGYRRRRGAADAAGRRAEDSGRAGRAVRDPLDGREPQLLGAEARRENRRDQQPR